MREKHIHVRSSHTERQRQQMLTAIGDSEPIVTHSTYTKSQPNGSDKFTGKLLRVLSLLLLDFYGCYYRQFIFVNCFFGSTVFV